VGRRAPVRTLFFLIDLTDKKLMDETYLGENDTVPQDKLDEVQKMADETGHEYMLTRVKHIIKKKG
jgi:hypothetical protein